MKKQNNSKIRVYLTKKLIHLPRKSIYHSAIQIRLQCEEQDLNRRTCKNAIKSGFKDSIA